MTKTMMKTDNDATAVTPVAIDLMITGCLSPESRAALDRLSYALQHQHAKCDAIGECGAKCGLRAGHPGEIHEQYAWGTLTRFRLPGEVLSTR